MTSMDRIHDYSTYLGDPTDVDWTSSGNLKMTSDGSSLMLTMGTSNEWGSLISSSRYVWYGKVSAKIKTSRTQGVATSFILFSDIRDEIDYEWVGSEMTTTETDYYFEGLPDCKLALQGLSRPRVFLSRERS